MDAKKNLLVLSSTFPRWSNDSTPTFVFELSRRLTNQLQVVVLAPHYPGAKSFEIIDNIRIYRFHYFFERGEKLAYDGGMPAKLQKNKLYALLIPFFLLANIIAAIRIVRKENIDIVQAHWLLPQGLVALFIKKIFNIPYLVTSHGSDVLAITAWTGLKKAIIKNAGQISAVSEAVRKKILTIAGDKTKVAVIPMGINTHFFSKTPESDFRQLHNISGPIALSVNRLSHEKRIDDIIRAWQIIAKRLPAARLLIVGDGPLRSNLEKLSKGLSLDDNIIFVGAISHKKLLAYYSSADVLLSINKKEGFGLAPLESLSCLCPIIINSSPLSRLIGHLDGVTVLREDDTVTLSEAISDCLNQDGHTVSVNTRQFIATNYGWQNSSQKYRELLVNL